jgi:integrase
VSEALALRVDDVLPGGVLRIRETKYNKSRLVPLHESVVEALNRYLDERRRLAGTSDLLFPSTQQKELISSTVNYTFPLRLATRDGYQFLLGTTSTLAVNQALYKKPLAPCSERLSAACGAHPSSSEGESHERRFSPAG